MDFSYLNFLFYSTMAVWPLCITALVIFGLFFHMQTSVLMWITMKGSNLCKHIMHVLFFVRTVTSSGPSVKNFAVLCHSTQHIVYKLYMHCIHYTLAAQRKKLEHNLADWKFNNCKNLSIFFVPLKWETISQ